jgi:hypothetical protein
LKKESDRSEKDEFFSEKVSFLKLNYYKNRKPKKGTEK